MTTELKKAITVKFLKCEIKNNTCYYEISITDLIIKETWVYYDRYSNLRNFHKKVSIEFNSPLPNFPPQRLIGNMDPSFILQRQKGLENYLNLLLNSFKIDDSIILKKFINESKENAMKYSKVIIIY